MNRVIKFRGKRIDNGEWVYGSLVVKEDKYYIALSINDNIKRDDYDVYMLEVIPETICQFTGSHDKNGKEIYEGDIIRCKKYVEGNFVDYCIENGFVEFKDGEFGLHRKQGYYQSLKKFLEYDYELEVIGNIYENSELLGGGNMLKIRDDVNLKELEKFGFKPKYDENTGKIYKYVCEKEIGYQNKREVTLITVMKDTYQRGQYDYVEYWKVIFEEKCNETVELLFDLIQANLVVKE